MIGKLEQQQNSIIIGFCAHFAMILALSGRITKAPHQLQLYNGILTTYIDILGRASIDEKKVTLHFYLLDRANDLLHWIFTLRGPIDCDLRKAFCETLRLKLLEITALP